MDGVSRQKIIEIVESEEIGQVIRSLTDAGEPMELLLPDVTDANERGVGLALSAVLERYGRAGMQQTLYVCVRELVANAVKANVKNVFFDEEGLDISDHEQYEKGIALFKKHLNEEWIRVQYRRARERGLDVRIFFTHSMDGLRIEVVNNIEITPEDERRIREKFAKGMSYDNLVSFYLEHGDDTEGEGIGFALSVLLLRGEHINPALFRVGSSDGRTIARIEIPFTEKFRSIRGNNPGPWKDGAHL